MVDERKGQKSELRATMKAKRDALSIASRAEWSSDACARLGQLLESEGVSTVFVYVQLRSELDTSPLIEWCWRSGVATAMPRCEPDGRTMTLYWIREWGDLALGAYGIREPNPEKATPCGNAFIPDAVIVPGLAFDRTGGRLGYGAGFYDRYYDALQAATGIEGGLMPPWLGLAYEEQLVEQVPTDGHDAYMDAIVTEQAIYRSGRRSGTTWSL
ncbi:5-formyltetrahydrofolate cyclo-ligase [Paenibacillus curdlanolyticus YK9]|uniref:5-formyltetrahydrofolate cyclo-ligase n=1 Tax=Paenibacillus curdlanolyticus YK9 TaxID=717606 RepID=E0I763_9BACL|nr:5-formyltetrahydrofolate cyclo-ligase [Paenibacillus curdlanolyticus]EFM11879.1 5-formyltetrahydrofolate cyclo-ligase [Paenibacillus curdlanolyticus YK9]